MHKLLIPCIPKTRYNITGIVSGVSCVKLFRKLLVGMGLDTEGLANRQHLEEKRKPTTIALTQLSGKQCLVVLNHIEEGALSLDIF